MMRRTTTGYILLEALVSLAILSVVSIVIQGSLRQAIETRGQAQDYTTARFLMEEEMRLLELQPRLVLGYSQSGTYPAPNNRFQYAVKVEQVEVPLPTVSEIYVPNPEEFLKQFVEYMGRISIKIKWTRAGQKFEVLGETLLRPEQIWVPLSGAAL